MTLPPVDEKTFTEEEESTYRVTQHNWYNTKLIKLQRHCQQNVVMKRFIEDMIVLTRVSKENLGSVMHFLFLLFPYKFFDVWSYD